MFLDKEYILSFLYDVYELYPFKFDVINVLSTINSFSKNILFILRTLVYTK